MPHRVRHHEDALRWGVKPRRLLRCPVCRWKCDNAAEFAKHAINHLHSLPIRNAQGWDETHWICWCGQRLSDLSVIARHFEAVADRREASMKQRSSIHAHTAKPLAAKRIYGETDTVFDPEWGCGTTNERIAWIARIIKGKADHEHCFAEGVEINPVADPLHDNARALLTAAKAVANACRWHFVPLIENYADAKAAAHAKDAELAALDAAIAACEAKETDDARAN